MTTLTCTCPSDCRCHRQGPPHYDTAICGCRGHLTAATTFSGTCPACGSARTYTPLVAKGRSRAYAPTSPSMNVRCGECSGPVTLTADI